MYTRTHVHTSHITHTHAHTCTHTSHTHTHMHTHTLRLVTGALRSTRFMETSTTVMDRKSGTCLALGMRPCSVEN